MRLRYTRKAAAELDAILDYIVQRSPQGARRVHERLQAVTTMLLRHPYAGQLTSKRRARRINTSPYPYVVFYEVTDDELIIIAVRHMARDPDTNPA